MGLPATSAFGTGIDVSEVVKLSAALRALPGKFALAFAEAKPEFGAYMSYSKFLEEGTHNPDGSWRIKPRPHIVPAVWKSASIITKAMTVVSLQIVQANVGKKQTQVGQKGRFVKAWLGVLNGPVRMQAVEWARALEVYEYGFHMRSIHGYVTDRSTAEIQAQQKKAEARRKIREARSKKKKKK